MVLSVLAASLTLVLGDAAAQANPRPADVSANSQPVAIEVAPVGSVQELTLTDGTRAIGRVERVDGDSITFRTTDGATLEVTRGQIATFRSATGRVVEGRYWPPDPNPTRLFFAPTARAIAAGEAYLGVYEIYIPFVQVGVTDRFSVGGGTPLIFIGSSDRPFWITPKLQVLSTGPVDAAVGVMHLAGFDDGQLGVAYGVVTWGSADTAVTVGGGYGYARGNADGGAPVLMVGLERRLSPHIKVVSENYTMDGGGIVSAGIRFMGERLSADFALASPLSSEGSFVFPMVNFVWKMR